MADTPDMLLARLNGLEAENARLKKDMEDLATANAALATQQGALAAQQGALAAKQKMADAHSMAQKVLRNQQMANCKHNSRR